MKKNKSKLTRRLRENWLVDALLGMSAFLALTSSLYFLAFPDGGYQGGRNPYYNLVVIFSRQTWDFLHTWSGSAMIFAAFIHILIHWQWITGTFVRSWRVVTGKRQGFSAQLTYNIVLDLTIAVCFLVCAISGMMFMFFPSSGPEGTILSIDKNLWDFLHTWSGVLMAITAVLHFILHWKWIVNITGKMFAAKQNKRSQPKPEFGIESTS